jgi:hypothetical protein
MILGNDTPLPNISKKRRSLSIGTLQHILTTLDHGLMCLGKGFYISSSYDGINWAVPQMFLDESRNIRYSQELGKLINF